MQLEYDLSVGALYIRLSGQSVARTDEVDDNTNVDLDTAGQVVGIEVVAIDHPWPIAEILRDYPLPDAERSQVEVYFRGPLMDLAPTPSTRGPVHRAPTFDAAAPAHARVLEHV